MATGVPLSVFPKICFSIRAPEAPMLAPHSDANPIPKLRTWRRIAAILAARDESTRGRAHGACEARTQSVPVTEWRLRYSVEIEARTGPCNWCRPSMRRAQQEEGDVRAHRRRRATKMSPATPMRPEGSGGAGASASLARLDD